MNTVPCPHCDRPFSANRLRIHADRNHSRLAQKVGGVTVRHYQNQDACENCRYVWRYVDFDGAGDWYCNVEENRPLCGSVELGESGINDAEINAWVEWANTHFVQPSGICDLYVAMAPEVQP